MPAYFLEENAWQVARCLHLDKRTAQIFWDPIASSAWSASARDTRDYLSAHSILRCAQPEWMALAQIAIQQVLAVQEGQRGFFAKPDIPPEGVKRPKRAGDMTYEERAQVGRLPYQDKTTPRTNKRKRDNTSMPPEEHRVLQEPDAFTCRLICCGLHKPGSFRNVFL